MPFRQGESGNPSGRPKGSKDKIQSDLRQRLADFLGTNFDKFQKDMEKLPAREFVQHYIKLIEYTTPKLKSTDLSIDLDAMPDSQIDELFSRILQSARTRSSDSEGNNL